jgi:hypothetical protein
VLHPKLHPIPFIVHSFLPGPHALIGVTGASQMVDEETLCIIAIYFTLSFYNPDRFITIAIIQFTSVPISYSPGWSGGRAVVWWYQGRV